MTGPNEYRRQTVFRGVSDADCIRQAERDAMLARENGYAPESQSWADDAGLRILTVIYRRMYGPPSAGPVGPGWVAPAERKPRPVRLGVAVAVVVIGVIFLASSRPSSPGSSTPAARASITGSFIRWEPVDDARGYAVFTVTNNGSAAGTAKCSVSVRNEFGNFGFDSLVGETVGAGQTRTFRLALSVGSGSRLINTGTVKDC